MTVVEVTELKCIEELFIETWEGKKLFEMRNTVENLDKRFAKGVILHLKELNAETQQYTGREIFTDVCYIMTGPRFGLTPGWCIMGLNPKMLKITNRTEIRA